MHHHYKIAITRALSSARELGVPLFVVWDCADGEMYAVSNDYCKAGFLTAEVFACAYPDGRLIFNKHYEEPKQCTLINQPTGH